MHSFHAQGWEARIGIVREIADERYRQIAHRIVAVERPDLLTDAQRQRWESWRRERLLTNECKIACNIGSDSHSMNSAGDLGVLQRGISAMRIGIQISSLVPSGLVVESVRDSPDAIILTVRSEVSVAKYPLCGTASRRIHSRYTRQVADLPCVGRQIRLRVITRRFVCDVPHCHRQIFAERFGDDVLPVRSRRIARLECIVHHLGLALSAPQKPKALRDSYSPRFGAARQSR
jgi:hypothetical protein